ncbi:hypothetical protein H6F61_28345 [Cyanobacteria bacterium FACHB-472]|nr:hypothetical protein [Cyanobacteria bacterium FACHB-472]
MSKAYPSSLTQAQYECLSDMIPEAFTGWLPPQVLIYKLPGVAERVMN